MGNHHSLSTWTFPRNFMDVFGFISIKMTCQIITPERRWWNKRPTCLPRTWWLGPVQQLTFYHRHKYNMWFSKNSKDMRKGNKSLYEPMSSNIVQWPPHFIPRKMIQRAFPEYKGLTNPYLRNTCSPPKVQKMYHPFILMELQGSWLKEWNPGPAYASSP